MSTSDAVQVHRVRVRDGLAFRGSLSADELAEAARFHFAADRERFVAGRGASRWLLGQALGVDPRALSFAAGPHGKPSLRAAARPLSFNRSHSGDWVLLALSERFEVGVDVEWARPDLDVLELGRGVFTAAEQRALAALLSSEARRAAFYRLWTRKEAALKAWGVGMYLEPRELEVGLDPAPRRRVEWPAGRVVSAAPAGQGALVDPLADPLRVSLTGSALRQPAPAWRGPLTIEDVTVDEHHAGAVAWG